MKRCILCFCIILLTAIPSHTEEREYEEHSYEYTGKLKIMWVQDVETRQVVYTKFKFFDDATDKWIDNPPLKVVRVK